MLPTQVRGLASEPASSLGPPSVATAAHEHATDQKGAGTEGRQFLDVGPREGKASPRRRRRLRRGRTRPRRPRCPGRSRRSRSATRRLRHRRPRATRSTAAARAGSASATTASSGAGLDRGRRRTTRVARGPGGEHRHGRDADDGENHQRDTESPTDRFRCHALILRPHHSSVDPSGGSARLVGRFVDSVFGPSHRARSARPIYVVARAVVRILCHHNRVLRTVSDRCRVALWRGLWKYLGMRLWTSLASQFSGVSTHFVGGARRMVPCRPPGRGAAPKVRHHDLVSGQFSTAALESRGTASTADRRADSSPTASSLWPVLLL
jgi:hypothetical protein